MASYLKASIKRSYAENFLAELEQNVNQYFFFVAKNTAWSNESSPSTYTDTVKSENTVLNNIIAYKKLNPSNILFALPRVEWTTGTVYDQYDDDVELFSTTSPKYFYVVTEENNIYKCIFNNDGAESTVKPTGVLATEFTTSDGYIWKYMATVRESDLPYELTDYVPVDFAVSSTDTETVNQYNTQIQAVNGEITRIDLDQGTTAGNYEYTIVNNGSSVITLRVGNFGDNEDGTHFLTITDPSSFGPGKIDTTALSGYIGYAIRVDASTQDPTQKYNYGIITGYSYSAGPPQSVTFTIKDDAQPFVVTPGQGSNYASVDIIPLIRVYGDGTGAYAFPVMTVSGATANITGVFMGGKGRNYSRAEANVATSVKAGTNHPTLTPIISPKGGHASNILKELGVKDILLIIEISEDDANKFVGGGSYRQFGIIKNPILSDGSGVIAGSNDPYFRDIVLLYEGNNSTDYVRDSVLVGSVGGDTKNALIGTETFTSCKVHSVRGTILSNDIRFSVKTNHSAGKFKTYLDRPNDYTVALVSQPQNPYFVGEEVQQTIPAGTILGSGYSFGYDIVARGSVLSQSTGQLDVRATQNSFVSEIAGAYLTGTVSGVTADISTITPRYGEYVYLTRSAGTTLDIYAESGDAELFKVVEVGPSYFDSTATPSYSGLHVLSISTSVSGVTGAMDATSSALTPNSFSNGDFVQQGVSANYNSDYASGTVYHWDFVNASYGVLYLTDVLGKFKSVQTDGITGSTLGAFIVSDVVVPEIEKTSGEILYIDNIRPINRTVGQKEEFRIRLGF